MKLRIIAVGKLRDRRLVALCDDYLERLRRHLPADVIEVKGAGDLVRRLPERGDVVALDAGGKGYSSEAFAHWLQAKMNAGRPALSFLIGGADGLGAEARRRAGEILSLGPMTLPHRLARLVLAEQLYRATTILRGEPYHH